MMYTEGGTSCVLGGPGDAVLNRMPAAVRCQGLSILVSKLKQGATQELRG
jgi:hypothetical protein